MAANRYPQLRAVHAHEIELARMSRLHNNTNTLCMGARWIAPEYALRILNTWRETPFEGGRHLIRLDKLSSC
jgi:ribose 5-phosphate isomerase B